MHLLQIMIFCVKVIVSYPNGTSTEIEHHISKYFGDFNALLRPIKVRKHRIAADAS